MELNSDKSSKDVLIQLAEQVESLADDVKLQALNLAITVARIQNKEATLKEMQSQFTELISQSNQSSARVKEVLESFRNERAMLFSLPSSSEVIEKRGAYDKIEASLIHVYNLSQEIMETLTKLKNQKQVN
ncbi:MAG: hypothetical protein V3V99_05560 [candidate division Zixibacteria bacterium]